jgi:hypothetical protein
MVLAILLGTATAATAERFVTETCMPVGCPVEHERHSQLQADLGLSVIQLAYEHPLGDHLAASLSAGVFGSYFLPWFDVGDDVIGVGGGVRVSWFARATGRGFYVAPYLRVHRVSGDHDDLHGTGLGFSTGAFAGWAFGITNKLDLRLGAGAQLIRHSIDTTAGTQTSSTPFVALDILVGYRL